MDRGESLDAIDLQADEFATFDDLLPIDPELQSRRKQKKTDARAVRTRQRVRLSRASSEDQIAAVLPQIIRPGDAWHVISGGNVDGLSYLAHLLKSGPADNVILSTWCMSIDDVRQLADWLTSGTIGTLDCYVGEIFPSQYAPAFELLCQVIRTHGRGRVAVFRNHSKVQVLASHARRYYVTVEGSANLNTNPRTEQATITRSQGLARFYADFFDGVKSIVRNFEDWKPNGWSHA